MRVNTPIFGLGWSGWKTAQKCLLEGPKVFQIFFWGGGMLLSPPLEPLDFAQNTLFLAISNGSRGEERYPIPPIFFSKILLILLEDVSGRFSNLTNLEPFHLDIAHIYRGISGQK